MVITKEMAEMEKNLQEEGERKEREMMEKVSTEHGPHCTSYSHLIFNKMPWFALLDMNSRSNYVRIYLVLLYLVSAYVCGLQVRQSWEKDTQDMRFKRLQHLLEKSNIYSKFLLTKMEQQQQEVGLHVALRGKCHEVKYTLLPVLSSNLQSILMD